MEMIFADMGRLGKEHIKFLGILSLEMPTGHPKWRCQRAIGYLNLEHGQGWDWR